MNLFYIYFISSYYLYSSIGLIIDIFASDIRINPLNNKLVKSKYLDVYENVFSNVIIKSIPPFVFAELMYLNYTNNTTIISYIFQYIFTLCLGFNIDYLINRFKHSKYFYKYHKKHHEQTDLFGFMTYYMNDYDFYISLIPVLFPVLFRFNPTIVNLWICMYMYKEIFIDHCNISDFGTGYYIHHNIENNNYGLTIIDNWFNTLNTNLDSIVKKNDSNSNIKKLPPTNNYRCYSYLCKTTNNKCYSPRCQHNYKYLEGKLHYSNFF
jgi:sterol desaturase/sphingolipid hydroxylase (fatty acid hydroxylase superfamily)